MKLWIARDKDGGLWLYSTKPKKYDHFFDADNWWQIDQSLFPEVTFENSPQEVELKLIEK